MYPTVPGKEFNRGRHLCLEVRKKRFGWCLEDHHGDGRIALHCKATAGLREELLRRVPGQFHVPAYSGHRGWVGLWLDTARVARVEWSVVRTARVEAYRATAPKKLVHELGGDAEE